ncbi:ribonuclease H-like domain-containing protein [Gymnopilus junonius]|uniref:DNA polymerase delta catalytic subunit n=1 Tax=Gymnopilus junonius TaxID=109634 RepID=A0A9P5NW50_GYMJU|nr:ribonuclease H-like domain-containing protein [Gymnopilus junonius]
MSLSRTETRRATSASTLRRPVAPAASFANVLSDLARKDGDTANTHTTWTRPPLPVPVEDKPSITFQKIDIRDGNDKFGASEIYLFGATKAGNSLLARVRGFDHYFYYPAPAGITEHDLNPLRERLNELPTLRPQSIHEGVPAVSNIELEDQCTAADGESRPFLKVSLRDHRHAQSIKDIVLIYPIHVLAGGRLQYRDLFSVPELSYEATVPYPLRFMVDHEVTAMTWLKIPIGKYERISTQDSISHCQLEVSVRTEDILICDTVDNREIYAPLRILSFDIETNVPPRGFPTARRQSVLQIGNMISIYADPLIRAVFTLGTCSPINGAQVLSFQSESDKLTAWQKFFLEVDPDIVIGYNITQFDIAYLLNRAQILNLTNFPYLGRIKSIPQRLDGWRPSFLKCPGYDGRLILDVFHHIREHYPGLPGEGAYKLDAVSSRFLRQRKEDIHYKDIPLLQNGNANSRRDLAIYCLKDVYLPLLLLSKLECFEVEVKEAKAAYVSFNTMREKRLLKPVARRCLDAIEGDYIVADDP